MLNAHNENSIMQTLIRGIVCLTHSLRLSSEHKVDELKRDYDLMMAPVTKQKITKVISNHLEDRLNDDSRVYGKTSCSFKIIQRKLRMSTS